MLLHGKKTLERIPAGWGDAPLYIHQWIQLDERRFLSLADRYARRNNSHPNNTTYTPKTYFPPPLILRQAQDEREIEE